MLASQTQKKNFSARVISAPPARQTSDRCPHSGARMQLLSYRSTGKRLARFLDSAFGSRSVVEPNRCRLRKAPVSVCVRRTCLTINALLVAHDASKVQRPILRYAD